MYNVNWNTNQSLTFFLRTQEEQKQIEKVLNKLEVKYKITEKELNNSNKQITTEESLELETIQAIFNKIGEGII